MNTNPDSLTATELNRRLAGIQDRVLKTLSQLVAIPAIAWPTYDSGEVDRSAEAVADLARQLSFDSVEILRGENPDGSAGYPAVVARKEAPAGAPTVVLYAHHDVQPPGDLALWESAPFSAEVRGDRMYGRGAADDKAGIMVHLAALEILGKDLGVGVVLFIEGEEEAGSPSFNDFIHRYTDRLRGDVIVVADSGNWAPGVPALTSSLRGLAALEFTVSTLDHAVHSGLYGGIVPDAMLALTKLLATLHNDDGSVAIRTLVSDPATEAELTEETVRADSGVLPGTRLIGHGSLSSRVWTQPSITVIGVDVPDVDHSSNTLQPRVRAKVSMRLAPGQNPAEALAALKAHLSEHVPFGAQLSFGAEETGTPWQANMADPVIEMAQACLAEGFGHEPVAMGLGGSIPFIADLLEVFPAASIVVTGVEDPDARAHSANESLYLPDFWSAIISEALFLDKLRTTRLAGK